MNQNTIQIVLQAAMQLAAAGKYTAASALLDTARLPESLAEYLLRAKIAAQQQNYGESIAHWRQALVLAPGDEAAQRGLARVQELQTRRGGRFYLRANLYYAALLLTIAGLGAALFLLWLRGSGGPSRSDIAAMRAAQEQQIQLSRQLAETLSASRNNVNPAATTAPIELKVDVPGVVARTENQELALSFEDGLFEPGGNVLRPAARQTLSALGRQLEATAQPLSIRVIGHTDNVALPPVRHGSYRDNSALALARASAVAEYLRGNTKLPARFFTAQGLGEDSAPYSNDSPGNRVRNRTVVIRVGISK